MLGIIAVQMAIAISINGCSNQDRPVNELYIKAFRLAESGKKCENSSYRDALRYYQDALKAAEKIREDYPSTQLAVDIVRGRAKIGPYSFEELKEKVIPHMQKLSEAEESLYKSAIFVSDHQVDSFSKVRALTAMAGEYARARSKANASKALDFALRTSDKISNASDKAWALAEITSVFAKIGQVDKSIRLAEAISDPYSKAWALSEIAKTMIKTGPENRVNALLDKALGSVKEIQRDFLRTWALTEIAQVLVSGDETDRAAEILSRSFQLSLEIEPILDRNKAIAKISVAYAEAGNFESAYKAAEYIEDFERRSDALAGIAIAYAKAHRFDEARKILNSPDVEIGASSRVRAMAKIASELIRAGAKNEAITLLGSALDESGKIKNDAARASARIEISAAYSEARDFGQALHVKETIRDAYSQALILVKMAEESARAGRTDSASEMLMLALGETSKIEDAAQKAELLASIDIGLGRADKKIEKKASRILHELIAKTNKQRQF